VVAVAALLAFVVGDALPRSIARLAPELDTVFFMTAPPYYFLSSTLIREVGRLGGAVTGLVPEGVEERLREKFRRS